VLRALRICALTVVLLAAGSGAARAFIVPTGPSLVHGECTFTSLSVHSGGGAFSAVGTGSCVANGTLTSGVLTISGSLDVDACAAKVAAGTATLSLAGSFPQVTGPARVVTHGTASTVAIAGGLTAAGSFVEIPRGVCPTDTVWTGSLAF
jgi:hypothetical protein